MKIKFKKMHGTGNDFIIVNYSDFPFEKHYPILAEKICNRNFGIGADGLLIVKASKIADFKMQYYNNDGTLAAMCGNGIRCFAKFVYEGGLTKNTKFTIETLSGIKVVELILKEEKIQYVKINMGKIILEPKSIPVKSNDSSFINQTIKVKNQEFIVSSALVGVPHTVIFTDDLDIDRVKKFGPLIENHELYPEKTNVNFANIIDRKNIVIRSWERGAGYTLACGTGASMVVGIAYKLDLVGNIVQVQVEGGNLNIEINEEDILMTASATNICSGIYLMVL